MSNEASDAMDPSDPSRGNVATTDGIVSGTDVPVARLTLQVFLLFALVYAGLCRGHFISTDEVLCYQATGSLWQSGVPCVRTSENYGNPGRGGYVYSVVNSGQSIAVLPLYATGHALKNLLDGTTLQMLAGPHIGRDTLVWGGEIEIFFVLLWNCVLTALMCAVFFAFQMRLQVSPRWSLAATLLFGMTSYAAGWSTTFFTQTVEALGLLWSFYLLFVDRQRPDGRARMGAGLVVAFVLACRYPAVIIVPGLLVYHGWVVWQRCRLHDSSARRVGDFLLQMAPLLLGILGGLALHFLDQYWKFETIRSQGGYDKARFDEPLMTGLWGFLFSPGDSIFLYTPLLLLTPAWFKTFLERHRAEAWFVLGQSAMYLVIFSKFPNWHGLWCFGPRYMVPLTALLMLGMGAWLQARGRKGLCWVAPFAIAGLWVQLSHFAVNFWSVDVHEDYMQHTHPYNYEAGSTISGDFLFVPRLSPLLAHTRALLAMDDRVDLWWVNVYRQFGVGRLLCFLLPWLGLVALCAWRIRASLRRLDGARTDVRLALPTRWVLAGTLLVLLGTTGLRLLDTPPPLVPPVAASTPSPSPIDSLMEAGVIALYKQKDAAEAIRIFTQILQQSPGHYGANFQMARALDAAGRTTEARTQWEKVLKEATAVHDETTAAEARTRLTAPR